MREQFVRFPNPDPIPLLFTEFCIVGCLVFVGMLFLVITALLSRIKRRRVPHREHDPFAAGIKEDQKNFLKLLCFYQKKDQGEDDGIQNFRCCFRHCKLGAIRFMLRPYFLLMEWIAMAFMIEIYRHDWKQPKDYVTQDIEFFDPEGSYHTGIIFFIVYSFGSALLTLGIDFNNAKSRATSIFLQFLGLRGVYQMYHEVEENADSQEMVELATLHATCFSLYSLLTVTIYGFEAFATADNQSGWYAVQFTVMFLSMVNIARAVNYRDKFGLVRKSVCWNIILIILRMSEIFMRITVLGLIGAYFNKSTLFIFVCLAIPTFIVLRLQRNKIFRVCKRTNDVKMMTTANKFRKVVDVFNQTILDYVFFDLNNEGFSKGMNYYKACEYVCMMSLLFVKNKHDFQVFEKAHYDWPFHVFFYLRFGLSFTVFFFCSCLLWCGGNYSVELYKACVENRVGELARRQRWAEIKMLIMRFEIESISEQFAKLIHQNCMIPISAMLEKNFSLGQLCLLRFPIKKIMKHLEWNKIKNNVLKKLDAKTHPKKGDGAESTSPGSPPHEISDDESGSVKDESPVKASRGSIELQEITHSPAASDAKAPDTDVNAATAESPSKIITVPMEAADSDPHEKKASTKQIYQGAGLKNMLSDEDLSTNNNFVKDFKKDIYCKFHRDPLHQLVNLILATEVSGEFIERFTERDDDNPTQMVKTLIEHEINVFMWNIRHKPERDGDIDTKAYRAYNGEGSFDLFDLHCSNILYTPKKNFTFREKYDDECKVPKEADRVHWKNIHIVMKPTTKKGEKKGDLIPMNRNGLRDIRFDNEGGFFIYKDECPYESFTFLQREPPSLLDEINEELKKELTTGEDKKVPTITMEKGKLEEFLDPRTGKLVDLENKIIRDALCSNDADQERTNPRGWRIAKLNGEEVKENFEEKWNAINKSDNVTAAFIYQPPSLFDCTGCFPSLAGCFERCRTRLDNAQQGVSQKQKFNPGDVVRLINYSAEMSDHFNNRVAQLKEVEDNKAIRETILDDAGLSASENIKIWDCQLYDVDKDGNYDLDSQGLRYHVADVFLAHIDKKNKEQYIVDIPEVIDSGNSSERSESQESDEDSKHKGRDFQIDMYDWTVVNTAVDKDGRKKQSELLKEQGIQEGWELEYICVEDEYGDELKLYVNNVESQKEVVRLLNNKNQAMKMKFLPPENENTWGSHFATCMFSLLLCVPCAWLSFRRYCGLGGQKYSARELITREIKKDDGEREYLVDDGDIVLVSCANPGWLSLSQGGQWGHCGIIYRYKESALDFLPKRFQMQLKNWKTRGIVKEGTPLVFEMTNHGREKDTNDFNVHLSHFQNWHMFRDTKKYFGSTIGIRKFNGERNREFYKALFQTMRQHHMKPYESVPMEFICSGLCFFPKTDFETQVQELFCSELVALFFYNLRYKNPDGTLKRRLIPDHVFPSEFQPADFGENKTCFPFFFMCCCGFSYFVCTEQRQAWRHPLKQHMGELLVLDISSIAEFEDEIKSNQRIQEVEKLQESDHVVRNYTESDRQSSHYRLLVNEEDTIETARRKVLEKRLKEKGCSIGIVFVELTWWVFYLLTFPFGIYIRIRTSLIAIDAAEQEAQNAAAISEEELILGPVDTIRALEDERNDRISGWCLFFTGGLYFIGALLFFHIVVMDWNSMSLWEFPLLFYYFAIMALGMEGICGRATRNCYDAMFRCGLRMFDIRLEEHSESYSKQIAPVKIPFITSIAFSAAVVSTYILEEIGYKQELRFDFQTPDWFFAAGLLSLIVALYFLCRYVIRSAIGMAGMMQDIKPSGVKTAQTVNAVIEFEQVRDTIKIERFSDLDLENLEDQRITIKRRIEDLEYRIDFFDKKIGLFTDADEETRDAIFKIMMEEQILQMKKELAESEEKLSKLECYMERKEEQKNWFLQLNREERAAVGDLAYQRMQKNETYWTDDDMKDIKDRYKNQGKEVTNDDLAMAWNYLWKAHEEQNRTQLRERRRLLPAPASLDEIPTIHHDPTHLSHESSSV